MEIAPSSVRDAVESVMSPAIPATPPPRIFDKRLTPIAAEVLKQDWRAAVDSLENAVRLNPGDDAAQRALAEARQRLSGQ